MRDYSVVHRPIHYLESSLVVMKSRKRSEMQMYSFKNIIFSRKSFDSASGHGYSPFDSATGKYILIPIPIGKSEQSIANKTKYGDIEIKPNYLPGIHVSNLSDLIFHDSLRFSGMAKREISNNFAHIDPWLGPCPWLTDKSNHPIGALGQVNAAQGHLAKNGVGVGSLFLFFSRFIPIKDRRNRIGVTINQKKGAYFLYGWLKVGRVAKSFPDIRDKELELRHPHATEAYFNIRKNNTIYISDRFLSGESGIPGCGYFPRLSKKLLLTSVDHYETPTTWELPGFFYELENRPTYLGKESRWQLEEGGEKCLVKIPARGQEFVFRHSNEFLAWFSQLLKDIS